VTGAQFAAVATIVGVLVLRERPGRLQYVGIALTLVGVTVLGLTG